MPDASRPTWLLPTSQQESVRRWAVRSRWARPRSVRPVMPWSAKDRHRIGDMAASGLRVTLAGKVGLDVDGVAVNTAGLGRPGRSALAYLTSNRHRAVSRDELANLLWADELPQSWEQMLRGVIFKLR